jgi:hypothetical protein
VELKKYIAAMHRFYEREGYYPSFGETRNHYEQESSEDEAHQPTRQRFIPRIRRRPWK